MGTTVFRNIHAIDKDAGVNGLVEYFIVEGNNTIVADDTLTAADGFGTFSISFPHQGQVSIKNQSKTYFLTMYKITSMQILLSSPLILY